MIITQIEGADVSAMAIAATRCNGEWSAWRRRSGLPPSTFDPVGATAA
jgi:hypothetical protein